RLRACIANDLHGLPHRGAGRDHVVNDHDLALQGRTHQHPPFTVILCFLAIECEGHIAPLHLRMTGKFDGSGRVKGNALVSRTEKHVELHTGINQCLSVELGQTPYRRTRIEQPRVEEIGADAPRLDLELAEAEHTLLQRETDEFATVACVCHDICLIREKATLSDIIRTRTQSWAWMFDPAPPEGHIACT